ncbi:UNVERIFIED_CONTAM: hypothetical protein Sradi_3773600 [Sesamum radiatum]|uniref:Integrase catalytic domain-containing protein n=1 Tax=Sesamum radiatum TaxID=300843 RepID=A0AAW2PZK3_SESRA
MTQSANMVQNDNSDCSNGDMFFVSTYQFVDALILDFGCSYHITHNREWFTSYRIKMYDGTVRTLFDVEHIPDLKKNQISLGTLHKNGFIPKADEDRKTIRVVKSALTVMKGKKSLVYFLKQKFELFAKFKLWKAEVENQTGRKIKFLRSDNGTEYTDSQFQKLREEHGIQSHFSVCKTPQQNGVAERMNRLPRASFGGKVAKKVWTGNPVDFDHLRIFGCSTYVHVPSDERSKLDSKSKQCTFQGYKKGIKGYKFWDPITRKMVISRDAMFDEEFML